VAVKLGTSAAAPGSVGGDGGVAAVVVGGPTPTGSASAHLSGTPQASGKPHPSGSASAHPSGTPHTSARPTPTPTPAGGSGYTDGTYRATATVRYRLSYPITLTVTIADGRITDITASYQAPESESRRKSDHACPILRSEALQAQSAHIHTVSGATDTSEAYITALAAVLKAA
jgi:uncharacterized protein with FMN-binding domain